jgi:acyl-CoA synthetase (AMP-forming)/AMP-acid ligase II
MSTSTLNAAHTLTALLESNRSAQTGGLHYHDSDQEMRTVAFAQLYERALGILYRLQRLGAKPGDKLILLLSGNEPFIDAFWAAVLGGIMPVPIAPGISDEHRHKVLRIARKLHTPVYLYGTAAARSRRRCGAHSGEAERTAFEALRSRAFLVDDLDELGRSGKPYRARPAIRPSSSSPPARPAIRRAWCSRTQICWPISAPPRLQPV